MQYIIIHYITYFKYVINQNVYNHNITHNTYNKLLQKYVIKTTYIIY